MEIVKLFDRSAGTVEVEEEVEGVEEVEVVGWHGGGCGTHASCSTQNIHNPNNNEDRNKCE